MNGSSLYQRILRILLYRYRDFTDNPKYAMHVVSAPVIGLYICYSAWSILKSLLTYRVVGFMTARKRSKASGKMAALAVPAMDVFLTGRSEVPRQGGVTLG